MKRHNFFLLFFLSTLSLFFTLSSMDISINENLVKDILYLTTQCINAKSAVLKDWINNEDNPFERLHINLLGGAPIEDEIKPCFNEQLFSLTNSTNKELLKNIFNINKKKKPQDCLKKFRLAIAQHQLTKSPGQNTKICELIISEQKIIKELSYQRCIFTLYEKKPDFTWFTTQKELLLNYLSIQEEYEQIDDIFIDKEKNERYKKELEKINVVLKKEPLRLKASNTADNFRVNPSTERLQRYIDCVQKLELLAPSPQTKEALRIAKFAQAIRIISKITTQFPCCTTGKCYITSDAVTILEQIIILANNIENIDDNDKDKIKILSEICPLFKQDPQQPSLIFYQCDYPTLLENGKWDAFYKACERIQVVVPEFPIPYPIKIKKHIADYGAPSTQWSAATLRIAINELITLLPYKDKNALMQLTTTSSETIAQDSRGYKDILKILADYTLLLNQKDITHLDDDGENTVDHFIFQTLFEIKMILMFCRDTYKKEETFINEILGYCDSIVEKCTNALIKDIQNDTGFFGRIDDKEACIENAYFHAAAKAPGFIFKACYEKVKNELKNIEEEKIRQEEEEGVARFARQKKDDEENQAAYNARIQAEQEKKRQDTVNSYKNKELTQLTIKDLLNDIKTLIVLRRTDMFNKDLSEAILTYINTLIKKIPLKNIQLQDSTHFFQIYSTIRAANLSEIDTSPINAYFNELLKMIQMRSGLFQNKFQAERIALFENYFPEEYADTDILKNWRTQMQNACNDTMSEKIFNIISLPFTLLFAPFRFLSDFYWPFCG